MPHTKSEAHGHPDHQGALIPNQENEIVYIRQTFVLKLPSEPNLSRMADSQYI